MATSSLLEGCQTLIQKGHESWKSYFSKWEAVAKYEEDVPESELLSDTEIETQSFGKKKVKQTKVKSLQSVKYKKSQASRKKLMRKKNRNAAKSRHIGVTKECYEDVSENFMEDNACIENTQLETILKTVFTEILKTNKNDCQMFTILSQTISEEVTECSRQFYHQKAVQCNNFSNNLQLMPSCSQSGLDLNRRSISPGKLNHRWTFFQSHLTPDKGIMKQIRNSGFDNFSKFSLFPEVSLNHSQYLRQLRQPLEYLRQPLRQSTGINSVIRNDCTAYSSSVEHVGTKLKSLEWDCGLKSLSSVCRKINREYFVSRSFLKMNVTQDGKRSRNLCLRKRTNSVTLSMENSNFITPERKPPERKCFSENVPQRKRTRPSKLFFGNEEDSESDDETEKQTPIIHCRNKKLKTEIIPEVAESDSDDCENIFDRVKTP